MKKDNCIFCKIANGELNTKFIYEDEDCVSFEDITPQAPSHALIIPRQHFSNINQVEDLLLLGKLLSTAKETAKCLNIEENYRIIINTGEIAGQSVFHIHLHVLGGRKMLWPPG